MGVEKHEAISPCIICIAPGFLRGNITLYNLHSSCLFLDYVCPHHWIVIFWHFFQETGWVPQHIVAQDESDNVLGVIPLYLKRFVYFYIYVIHCEKENYSYTHVTHTAKGCLCNCLTCFVLGCVFIQCCSHSYGEYVFDHSWADAYYSYGSRYYPKLQCCVPFTPVTGPRILVRDTSCRDQVFDILVSALVALTIKVVIESKWSSCCSFNFILQLCNAFV